MASGLSRDPNTQDLDQKEPAQCSALKKLRRDVTLVNVRSHARCCACGIAFDGTPIEAATF